MKYPPFHPPLIFWRRAAIFFGSPWLGHSTSCRRGKYARGQRYRYHAT